MNWFLCTFVYGIVAAFVMCMAFFAMTHVAECVVFLTLAGLVFLIGLLIRGLFRFFDWIANRW